MPRLRPATWWNPNSATRQKEHERGMSWIYRHMDWLQSARLLGQSERQPGQSIMQVVAAAKASWPTGEKDLHTRRLWSRDMNMVLEQHDWEEQYIAGRLNLEGVCDDRELHKMLRWNGYPMDWISWL